MARKAVPQAVRRQVRDRADNRCEYGQHPASYSCAPFVCEHVLPRAKGGGNTVSELAWGCPACDNHKGTDLAGIDKLTKKLIKLFNPRRHKWERHFRWNGPYLVGRTAIGRVTIAVLDINAADRVLLRQSLIDEGAFPPS